MKNILLIVSAFFVFTLNALAAEGDTTHIRVHDKVDIVWFGNYDRTGFFPVQSKTYRKVLMKYTLGCASTGCSNWDYTNKIELLHNTGKMDSNISSIDTVSTNPLVLDTNYNVFTVYDPYELGRVITPYGTYMASGSNGFNNGWEREFWFDVSDFIQFLDDSVIIRSHYSGWSSGFSSTVDFYFIEGTPRREVLDLQMLYHGSSGYQSSAQFESNLLPPLNVAKNTSAKYSKFRITPSGHGFDNNTSCAEFCERTYTLKLNNIDAFTENMWKDDCGMNAVYPQGGTWIYNRANWCPGEAVPIFEHEAPKWIMDMNSTSLDIDLNVQDYTWSGNQAPSYIFDVHMVNYGDYANDRDIGLHSIVAPSNNYNYNRFNPVCDNPKVMIINEGKSPLQKCDIAYWVDGGLKWYYEWTGYLEYGETEMVVLPPMGWSGLDPISPKFHAEVSYPDGFVDDFTLNNKKTSSFELPPVYGTEIILEFRTNSFPSENKWFLRDEDGNIIYQKDGNNLAPNTTYRDTLFLQSEKCYSFELTDHDPNLGGGDGISWWANSDGNGICRFREPGIVTPIITFNPDFGNQIMHHFMTDVEIYNAPQKTPPSPPVHGVGIHEIDLDELIEVYPVPSQGVFNVNLDLGLNSKVEVTVIDLMGKEVYSANHMNGESFSIDLTSFSNGQYNAVFTTTTGKSVKNLLLLKD